MLCAENGKWRRVGRSHNQKQCGHQLSLNVTAGDAVGTASPQEKVPKEEGDSLSGEAGPCSWCFSVDSSALG